MKRLRYAAAGTGLFIILAAAALTPTFAPKVQALGVNDFIVTDFKADETLTRNDPQGELHIVEHVYVNFYYNHGLLRAIPDRYKGHSLQLHVNSITSDSGAPTQYTTYDSNGNTVLKIGDPDRIISGQQEYTIDYTLRNVITFYKDHDELYWDVNGDQWRQTFQRVRATLHLPAGLQQDHKPVCYTGGYGSTGHECAVGSDEHTINVATTGPLLPGQTLTFVAGFDKGYFHPSAWYETIGEYSRTLLALLLPILVIGGGSFLYWWRNGRDAKGRGVIIPEYDAPDGLKPLQAGTVADFNVDNRDITATIINLAIRGYLKIIETKEDKRLRKDSVTYTLQLLKADFSGLDAAEVIILKALFDDVSVGALVDLSSMKNKFYKTAESLRKIVEADLTTQGYFRGNPLKTGTGLGSIAILLIFGLGYAGHFMKDSWLPAVIGLMASGFIAFVFAALMDARTAKGVAAKEHIMGLKMYLEVAEKDRLEKLQGPQAAYAENAKEPQKTVQLFEKLLPYAMVLGVEKQWAEQFKDIYTSPPAWYAGNWATFNAIYLTNNLNSGMNQTVNTAFSAPGSSSSSGFGGGGFSGGGGGGGGGGGW